MPLARLDRRGGRLVWTSAATVWTCWQITSGRATIVSCSNPPKAAARAPGPDPRVPDPDLHVDSDRVPFTRRRYRHATTRAHHQEGDGTRQRRRPRPRDGVHRRLRQPPRSLLAGQQLRDRRRRQPQGRRRRRRRSTGRTSPRSGPRTRSTAPATTPTRAASRRTRSVPGETTGIIPQQQERPAAPSTSTRRPAAGDPSGLPEPGLEPGLRPERHDADGLRVQPVQHQLRVSGPNKVRTAGDLLIEYAIDQGGARADITGRTWTGTAGGRRRTSTCPRPTCGGNPCAAGTINTSPIPAAESDGLITTGSQAGPHVRRGADRPAADLPGGQVRVVRQRDAEEPVLGLLHLAAEGLHRRRSASTCTNCGKVIIRKQTDPGRGPEHDPVRLHQDLRHRPRVGEHVHADRRRSARRTPTCSSAAATPSTEDVIPANWAFASLDCSASTGVTPTITARR